MKKNKQLYKLIKKMVEISFKNGQMLEFQIIKCIKILKSLPKYQVIEALSIYLKELKRLELTHTMFIETTIPLSSIQINKIKKIMEKRVKITKVKTDINPDILGGFKLRVGDEIWDETIFGKIQQVKEAIKVNKSN